MQHTNEKTKREIHLRQKGSTNARSKEESGNQAPEKTTTHSGERTDPENDHKQPKQAPESFPCANALIFTSVLRQVEQRRLRGSTAPTHSNCGRRKGVIVEAACRGIRATRNTIDTSHCSRQRQCDSILIHTRINFLRGAFCQCRPPCRSRPPYRQESV